MLPFCNRTTAQAEESTGTSHDPIDQSSEAVKHIVGNFPALFGTDDGRRLQRIAAERSWPLFWAVGDGKLTHLAIDTNPTPYRCNLSGL